MLAPLLLMFGCDTDEAYTMPAPGPVAACEYTATDLDASTTLDDGTVPADLIAAIEGTHDSTLSWDHGEPETGLTVTLDFSDAPVQRWEGELVHSDGTREASDECPPYTTLSASLSLSTQDERVAVAADVEVTQTAEGAGRIDAALPLGEVGEPALPIDPADYDTVTISIAINASAEGTTGELAGSAVRTINEGDADYDETWEDDVARWQAP